MSSHTAPSSSASAPSTSLLGRAVGGGLAAVSMILVNLGCGCSGELIDRDQFSWGCLVEAEVDGAPAQAEAQLDARGTTVRLSPSSAEGHHLTVEIPGSSLASLPIGEQPVDAGIEIALCAGAELGACVPVRDVVLEVTDLGDGTARASYTGTTLDARGLAVPAEGSFVFTRDGV